MIRVEYPLGAMLGAGVRMVDRGVRGAAHARGLGAVVLVACAIAVALLRAARLEMHKGVR